MGNKLESGGGPIKVNRGKFQFFYTTGEYLK